jgi:Ca2+ transporting ATPase
MSDNTLKILCVSICNNSNANPKFEQSKEKLVVDQIGNKTECALLECAYRLGFDYKLFRNKNHILKVFPFSSSRKKMGVVYQDDKGSKFVFVKGAPDFMMPYCTKYITS